MTQTMAKMGSERLVEMELHNALPEDILRDLRDWWTAELRENENKVVSLEAWRERRRWLSR